MNILRLRKSIQVELDFAGYLIIFFLFPHFSWSTSLNNCSSICGVISFVFHVHIVWFGRLELRDERRLENRSSFANIWSDMVYGISLFILLYFNQSKVSYHPFFFFFFLFSFCEFYSTCCRLRNVMHVSYCGMLYLASSFLFAFFYLRN